MPFQKTDWFGWSFAFVAAITAFRVVGLAFSDADIFVDEAQYWFWGQNLDFGYFSKPPLTAWVIRATTDIAGSNAAFWVRFPVPWFHGATALILGALAARLFGARAAMWVSVSYVTLPIVAVGSALISTDTILAPFFAAGLLFYFKLAESGRKGDALIAGAMIGLAFMAKYAAVYFLLGAGLAAVFVPGFRISWSNALIFLAAFLLVISPNVIWNLSHDLTTVQHTLDNVDWVRDSSKTRGLNLRSLAEFTGSQFLAVGPVIFVALFLMIPGEKKPEVRALLWFCLPVVLLVATQALLSKAYGNWAFAAYFTGVVAAVPWLLTHSKKFLWAGLVFNMVVSLSLPVLGIVADDMSLNGEQSVMVRYLGRDEFSQQIIDLAKFNGNPAIVAANRSVLADLFYTGLDQDVRVFSVAANGRPKNYYQQNYPFKSNLDETVLLVTNTHPLRCGGKRIKPLEPLNTQDSAYFQQRFWAYLVAPGCYEVLN